MCVLHLLFPYETWLYLDTRDTSGMDYDSNVHIFGFFDRVKNAIKKKWGAIKLSAGRVYSILLNFLKKIRGEPMFSKRIRICGDGVCCRGVVMSRLVIIMPVVALGGGILLPVPLISHEYRID